MLRRLFILLVLAGTPFAAGADEMLLPGGLKAAGSAMVVEVSLIAEACSRSR